MKRHLALILFCLMWLAQSSCLNLLTGLVGLSADSQGSSAGTTNLTGGTTNHITTDDELFDEAGFSEEAIELPVGIAKNGGDIDAQGISGSYLVIDTTSEETTARYRLKNHPGREARNDSASDRVYFVRITGAAGTISGTDADGNKTGVAKVVASDLDYGFDIGETFSEKDGSFVILLPRRYLGKSVVLEVADPETDERGLPIIARVYEAEHFNVGISLIPALNAQIAINDGFILFNQRAFRGPQNNDIVLQRQSGGPQSIFANDVEPIHAMSFVRAGMIWETLRRQNVLGLDSNDDAVILFEGDSTPTRLSDARNNQPLKNGNIKRLRQVRLARQLKGEFVALNAVNNGLPVPIELIPTFVADGDNDLLFNPNTPSKLTTLSRTLTFTENDELMLLDETSNGKFEARLMNVGFYTNKTATEIVALKKANPGITKLAYTKVFETAIPVQNPVASKRLLQKDQSEFFVFECQIGGYWQICMNEYDSQIIQLTSGATDHSQLDVSALSEFIAASVKAASDNNHHIILVHVATGDIIQITKNFGDRNLINVQPAFSGASRGVLTYLSRNENGDLLPNIVNLGLHPVAGKYIPTSPHCITQLAGKCL